MTRNFHQDKHQIVDVKNWLKVEPYDGIFAKGAREKKALYAPGIPEYSFLLAGTPYLFKESFNRYPWQFWIEIFSYRLGRLIGIEVPSTFVAFDSSRNVYGALIQWFYKRSDQYVDGGNIMRSLIPDYESKVGKQHNLQTLINADLDGLEELFLDYWSEALVFDALMGNTDRHHDNWGIIYRYPDQQVRAGMAPLFDNGTSMGHEIIESNLVDFTPNKLQKYITSKKAKHHISWDLLDNESLNHSQMVRKFSEQYPQYLEPMKKLIEFDLADVNNILHELTQFDIQIPLSKQRAVFMLELIKARQNELKGVFHEFH